MYIHTKLGVNSLIIKRKYRNRIEYSRQDLYYLNTELKLNKNNSKNNK